MTLFDYFDRYGIDVDQIALALLRYSAHLDPARRNEILRALQPEQTSAAQANLLNLADEAQSNLELAKKLRDSLVGPNGQILGTVSETSRALQAVDKVLDGASKRFGVLYNQSTMQALEEAVKETMAEADQATYERFMTLLEEKVSLIR